MASMIEIAGYAYAAGLRNPTKLAMAVAIAEAESGGNPKAYNGNGRDESYGLWQINMKPSEVGDRKKDLGISSNEALFDPLTNARAMVKISKSGSTWKPWTTYPLRAAAYLPAAQLAAAAFLADPSIAAQYAQAAAQEVSDATGLGAIAGGLGALAQGFTETVQTPLRVVNWLTEPGTWIRIALGVLGGAMVIGGALLFARPYTDSAAGAVTKVLPTGKVGALLGAVSKGAKR